MEFNPEQRADQLPSPDQVRDDSARPPADGVLPDAPDTDKVLASDEAAHNELRGTPMVLPETVGDEEELPAAGRATAATDALGAGPPNLDTTQRAEPHADSQVEPKSFSDDRSVRTAQAVVPVGGQLGGEQEDDPDTPFTPDFTDVSALDQEGAARGTASVEGSDGEGEGDDTMPPPNVRDLTEHDDPALAEQVPEPQAADGGRRPPDDP